MKLNKFEELEVWKVCRNLHLKVADLVKSFPKDEKFRLVDQLLRSSRSITANIAEGFSRFHYQENIQFCRQARGSLSETLDHLICSFDENYINESQIKELRMIYFQCLKLLNGYIMYLNRKKNEI